MDKKRYCEFVKIQKIVDSVAPEDQSRLRQFVEKCQIDNFTLSKTYRRTQVMRDVMMRFPPDLCDAKYNAYFSSHSQFERFRIRYGESSVVELKRKYAQRPRRKEYISVLSVLYWVRKGKSEDEAREIISSIQSERSKKKKVFALPRSSIRYWTSRGYSIQEAQQLRKPFNQNNGYDLDKFVKKFGEAEGLRRWSHRTSSRRRTMMDRYGGLVLNGSVSKESIKVFLPLYKKIRRFGILKEDIFWGIGGSREYATKFHGKNYFFDFVVRSKKLVIEYNNKFWHYRPGEIWRNPFYTKESSKENEDDKRAAMESRGYTVMYIWNDDDIVKKIEEIVEWIKLN